MKNKAPAKIVSGINRFVLIAYLVFVAMFLFNAIIWIICDHISFTEKSTFGSALTTMEPLSHGKWLQFFYIYGIFLPFASILTIAFLRSQKRVIRFLLGSFSLLLPILFTIHLGYSILHTFFCSIILPLAMGELLYVIVKGIAKTGEWWEQSVLFCTMGTIGLWGFIWVFALFLEYAKELTTAFRGRGAELGTTPRR